MNDWLLIIIQLCKHHKTQLNLSKVVNVPTTTLANIKSGSTVEPRHSAGQRILKAYERMRAAS